MSDWVYRRVLEFYPPAFRERYGEDFVELLRDRARDETGLFGKIRLWWDLVADLTFSLPRTYGFDSLHGERPAVLSNSTFAFIDAGMPTARSFCCGTILSLLAFGSLFLWVGAVRNKRIKIFNQFAFASMGKVPPLHKSELPAVMDANKAMVRAIREHQIVMFGETHGNKQEYEWLCHLVKEPAFADQVDDVVVEFGNSLYQKSVDRYIAGEDIPLDQVQRAWRNMIGAVGAVSPVYEWFYKAVRDSNLQRHDGHRIRIVLGDPYGDWERIKSREDLGPYLAHRDDWYAEVVKEEVLAKHHRALLIMGAGHFQRRNGPGLVEKAIRAEGVEPYLVVLGTNAVGSYDDIDRRFDALKPPVILRLNGTWPGDLPAMPVVTGGIVAPNELKMSDVADAMLYLGSRDSLTQVNMTQAQLAGTTYGDEINRRLMIQAGRILQAPTESETPQYPRPMQQVVSTGVHLAPPNPPQSIHDPLPPRPESQ